MAETKFDHLPQDCIVHLLSFASPKVACRSSLVSPTARAAATSDVLWEQLLPSDYRDIISRSVSPVLFSSKKELFLRLCSPLLIDGGTKSIWLDRSTGKKCYMLSARELTIAWGSNPLYWCWKSAVQSRFPEIVELVMTNWLEIHGSMSTRNLSPNTSYGAYLVFGIAGRAYGLDSLPPEVSVEVGNCKSTGNIHLCQEKLVQQRAVGNQEPQVEEASKSRAAFDDDRSCAVCQREDGWSEAELGYFSTGDGDDEVKVSIKETEGEHLKGGLIIEGIELRPQL